MTNLDDTLNGQRAISLIQPWATLIVAGLKRYETRSWSTPYRGRILIHASKKLDKRYLARPDVARLVMAGWVDHVPDRRHRGHGLPSPVACRRRNWPT